MKSLTALSELAILAVCLALLFLAAAAHGQTTQPVTGPSGTAWHVSAKGDQGTVTLAYCLSHVHGGDTINLRVGDRFPGLMLPKGIAGIHIQRDGSAGYATVDAPTGLLFLLAVGQIEVGPGIDFTDTTRIPGPVSFTPHVGGFGVTLRQCDGAKLWLHDCILHWHAFEVDVEASHHQDGTVIENCTIGPCYGSDSPPQRSQGIYDAGQYGEVIRNCFFQTCGWYPGVAFANSQNHGVYHHSGFPVPPDACGPVTVTGCTFVNCAAAGPTSNAGGVFDGNLVVNCAQDGSGMNAWLSGPSGTFSNNIICGGFFNGISKDVFCANNVFVNPGPIALNIDIPAGSKNWRNASNTIHCDNNVAMNLVQGNVVHQTNLGGAALSGAGNSVMPANPVMEELIRRAVASGVGIGVKQ